MHWVLILTHHILQLIWSYFRVILNKSTTLLATYLFNTNVSPHLLNRLQKYLGPLVLTNKRIIHIFLVQRECKRMQEVDELNLMKKVRKKLISPCIQCTSLRRKRFLATVRFFCRGGWWWSRPYSGVLGCPDTSRPYKWNSRGGWWYEPPLQMEYDF